MSQANVSLDLDLERRALSAAEQERDIIAAEEASLDSEDAFETWQGRLRNAKFAVARLQKRIDELRATVERQEREDLLRRIGDRRAANEKLARRMVEVGNPIVEQLRELLRDLAEADLETIRLNSLLPADVPKLVTADTIARRDNGCGEEIISEDEVELWVNAQGDPVSDQTSVEPSSDGYGRKKSASLSGPIICYRRRFRAVEHYPALPARNVEPLYKAIRMPFFDRPGHLLVGENIHGGADAIRILDRSMAPQTPRVLQTKFVPIDRWQVV
jgi:hypothetical protein